MKMNWKFTTAIWIAFGWTLAVPPVFSESPPVSQGIPLPPGLLPQIQLPGGVVIPGLTAPAATPPPPADSTPSHTLLTAMVAEGANIWLPSTLIIKSGVPVKLTLRNVSKAEHGFAIDDLGVTLILPAGETKEVSIAPGASGTLRYYCPLHKGHVGGQLLVQ